MRNSTLLMLVALMASAACNNDFGPEAWDDTPRELVVFSASRPELLGLPAAYDAVLGRVIRIEEVTATNNWDFLLVEEEGDFYFLPAGAIPGMNSRAGIAEMPGVSFDDVIEAPRDTTTYVPKATLLVEDGVYVLRTRRAPCPTFGTSVMYGKLIVNGIDEDRGFVEISVVRNPFCDLRDLVPPAN